MRNKQPAFIRPQCYPACTCMRFLHHPLQTRENAFSNPVSLPLVFYLVCWYVLQKGEKECHSHASIHSHLPRTNPLPLVPLPLPSSSSLSRSQISFIPHIGHTTKNPNSSPPYPFALHGRHRDTRIYTQKQSRQDPCCRLFIYQSLIYHHQQRESSLTEGDSTSSDLTANVEIKSYMPHGSPALMSLSFLCTRAIADVVEFE